MKFRISLFVLLVCVQSLTDAFGATCTAYSSLSSLSGYTQARVVGDTTNCTSYTTQYYIDVNTKTYDTVYSCSACSTATGTVVKNTLTGGIGDCTYEYSWCAACSYSSTRPNSVSAAGGPSNPTGCATTKTEYVTSSSAGVYYAVTSCDTCMSGYWFTYQYGKLNGCPYTYTQCSRCNPGTYKINQSCVKCSVGTYSDAPNAATCTTCPSASGFFTNSALSTAPSVTNSKISSPAGSASRNKCFLRPGTYYDAKGTWSLQGIRTCNYDGTYELDKCSEITTACLNSDRGLTAQAVQTGSMPLGTAGGYCYCATNGKYFYMTSMGADATGCNSGCAGACASAIANSTTLRANLGCD